MGCCAREQGRVDAFLSWEGDKERGLRVKEMKQDTEWGGVECVTVRVARVNLQ